MTMQVGHVKPERSGIGPQNGQAERRVPLGQGLGDALWHLHEGVRLQRFLRVYSSLPFLRSEDCSG
jgi:hypothetical protein